MFAIAPAQTRPRRVRTLKLSEGTNIAVTVSPDRKALVFAMHGTLWALPIGGGQARALTDPLLDPARPDWSPRGDRVAFESYFGGAFHIWTMKPDGSDVRRLTAGHGDDREPRFSPDGTKIAFSSDRAFQGTYDIWVADVAGGKLTRRTSGPEDAYEPAWSPDGSEIAYVSGTGAWGDSIQASMLPAFVERWSPPRTPSISSRRPGRPTGGKSPIRSWRVTKAAS